MSNNVLHLVNFKIYVFFSYENRLGLIVITCQVEKRQMMSSTEDEIWLSIGMVGKYIGCQ